MKKREFAAKLAKQAKSLQRMNPYFKDHPDEYVYIHWKDDLPYVLPHKMNRKDAKSYGFDSFVNPVTLSTILQ